MIIQTCQSALLIRNTPREKLSIQDEIDDAISQARYRKNMDATKSWLTEQYARGYNHQTRIMNTGLIYYSDVQATSDLRRKVYEQCWRLEQPECQIIWALYAQHHEDQIQRVDWSQFNIEWRVPIG